MDHRGQPQHCPVGKCARCVTFLIPFFFFSGTCHLPLLPNVPLCHFSHSCGHQMFFLFFFFTHPAPFLLVSPAVHFILLPIQPMPFSPNIACLCLFLLARLTSCFLLFLSPASCSASYDLSHSPLLRRLLSSESVPLPDTD